MTQRHKPIDAGRGSSVVNAIVIPLFLASLGFSVFRLAGLPFDWMVIPAAIAAWFVVDLISGLTHLYLDYRPCPANIGLDRLFHYKGSRASPDYAKLHRAAMAKMRRPIDRLAFEFKVHHPRPDTLGRRPLIRQIRTTIMFVTLPWSMLVSAALLFGWTPDAWLLAALLTIIVGTTFAQYFHGMLHRPDAPIAITAMRRLGLVMTAEAHQIHHDTLQRDFATINGWSNPLINIYFRFARRRGRFDDAGLTPQ